jgi:hypothetical protein
MDDFSERVLCSDGTCTGIINEKGFCNICGKPLQGWQERGEQKRREKEQREEEREEKKQQEEDRREGKKREIEKKEEKIDIKNLLQKEIAKAKEEKRVKEQGDGKRQEQAARVFDPVVLAADQLKSELSNNKQIEFGISDHHVEIHFGKNRKVVVSSHGPRNEFVAVEEIEYEYPEYHVSKRDFYFKTSGEIIYFLVKVCADFIANQEE